MNDEDLDYCGMCGEVEDECVCEDMLLLYVDDSPAFRFEFAHEMCSYDNTQFKKILPDD